MKFDFSFVIKIPTWLKSFQSGLFASLTSWRRRSSRDRKYTSLWSSGKVLIGRSLLVALVFVSSTSSVPFESSKSFSGNEDATAAPPEWRMFGSCLFMIATSSMHSSKSVHLAYDATLPKPLHVEHTTTERPSHFVHIFVELI